MNSLKFQEFEIELQKLVKKYGSEDVIVTIRMDNNGSSFHGNIPESVMASLLKYALRLLEIKYTKINNN